MKTFVQYVVKAHQLRERETPHLRSPGAAHRCWICSSSGCSENKGWRLRCRPHTQAPTSLLPETTWQPSRNRWLLLQMSQRRVRSWPLIPGTRHEGSGCTGQETDGTPRGPLPPHSRWRLSGEIPATNRGSWRQWAQQRPRRCWAASRAWSGTLRWHGTWCWVFLRHRRPVMKR